MYTLFDSLPRLVTLGYVYDFFVIQESKRNSGKNEASSLQRGASQVWLHCVRNLR